MSVDALLPTLIVNPRPDSQGDPRRDQHHEGEAHHHDKEGEENPATPLRNAFGQVIGKNINITA